MMKIFIKICLLFSWINFALASDINIENLIFERKDIGEEIKVIRSFQIVGNKTKIEGRNLSEKDSQMLLPFLKSKYLEDEVFRVFEINDTEIFGRIKNKEAKITQVNNTNNEDSLTKEDFDLSSLNTILELTKKNGNPNIRNSLFALVKTHGFKNLFFWIEFLGKENYYYIDHLKILLKLECEFGRGTIVTVTNMLKDKQGLFSIDTLVSSLDLLKKKPEDKTKINNKVNNTDDDFFNY